MSTAEELIAICESHYSKDGEPFSVEGRKWVKDELFVPATSWKLWPRNPDKLCDACVSRVGKLEPWSPKLVRSIRAHDVEGCSGLQLLPIVVVILNLQRGAGKTYNVFALVFALMLSMRNVTIAFAASAKDQADALIRENLLAAIDADDDIKPMFETIGDRIICDDTGAVLEVCATSYKSITGRRRRVIIAEEARDMDAQTFAALLPSIRAQTRYECPQGHAKVPYDAFADSDIPKCPACKRLMHPTIPLIILPSTSGVDDGTDDDWFNDLCDKLEARPVPWAHLYRDAEAANPSASKMEYDAIIDTFGDVPGLAESIDVEMHNVRKGRGRFLDDLTQRAIEDPTIGFVNGDMAPCFAFIDTSITSELTSVVIVGDDRDAGGSLWQNVRLFHAKWWEPKKQPGGKIDGDAVQAHIDWVFPLFPGLKWAGVDCRSGRGIIWALTLVETCNNKRPGWGHLVHAIRPKYGIHQTRDRQDAYQAFESRARGGTYRQPPCPRIIKELRGLIKVQRPDGTWEVKDRSRKKSHAELVDGIVECCRQIHLEMTRPSVSMGDLNDSADDSLRKLFGGPVMAGLTRGKPVF